MTSQLSSIATAGYGVCRSCTWCNAAITRSISGWSRSFRGRSGRTPPATGSPFRSHSAVRRAYDAGLSDSARLQLVAECVFAGLVGIVDNLAGRIPLDEFLQPQAWKAG